MVKGKKSLLEKTRKNATTLLSVLGTILYTARQHFLEAKKPQPSWGFKMHLIFNLIKSFVNRGANESVEDAQTVFSQVKPKSYKNIANRTIVIPQHYRERAMKDFSAAYPEVVPEHESKAGPLTAEWITYTGPKTGKSKKPLVMLYLHGGAYYLGSVDSHRDLVCSLVRRSEGEALVLNYRLAPQDPFPFAIHDSIAGYLYMLDSCSREGYKITPQNIGVIGDSAGGGLTMATLIALRKMDFTPPACAVGISPWLDLTHSTNSFILNRDSDYLPGTGRANHITSPLISDDKWVGRDHYYAPNSILSHPLVSPYFEVDLRGLPPLLIQVGDGELLRDEGILFALKASGNYQSMDLSQNAKNAGNSAPTPVSLEIYGEMPHVFQAFSFTNASKLAIEHCARFLKQVIQGELTQEESSSLVATDKDHFLKEFYVDYKGNIEKIEKIEIVGDGNTIKLSF